MTITFNIKGGELKRADKDTFWYFKALWAWIRGRSYTRLFSYQMIAEVDSIKNLKVGHVFISGLSKPHVVWRIVRIIGNRNVIAYATNYVLNKNPDVAGVCAIVGYKK
jgi:hypothetical protein